MECAEVISGIQILHVFGQLDDLDWQDSDGRPYNNDFSNIKHLKSAADGIRTINEQNNDLKNKVGTLLNEAREIYFLGFGYDKNNLNQINILEHITETNRFGNPVINKKVVGSAFKLWNSKRTEVNKYIKGIKLGKTDEDCYKFLEFHEF